jgi:hypothetical protein
VSQYDGDQVSRLQTMTRACLHNISCAHALIQVTGNCSVWTENYLSSLDSRPNIVRKGSLLLSSKHSTYSTSLLLYHPFRLRRRCPPSTMKLSTLFFSFSSMVIALASAECGVIYGSDHNVCKANCADGTCINLAGLETQVTINSVAENTHTDCSFLHFQIWQCVRICTAYQTFLVLTSLYAVLLS